MEFPPECNGFAIPFKLTAVSDNIKFGAIISELYNNLTLDDLKTMKMNKQNYLEVKETDFIAACSYCFKDITSVTDLKKCGTDDCLYRSCSSEACYHVIEKIDYCNNCFTVNQSISNDTSDRIYIVKVTTMIVLLYLVTMLLMLMMIFNQLQIHSKE